MEAVGQSAFGPLVKLNMGGMLRAIDIGLDGDQDGFVGNGLWV